jgi:hypothetical protein
MSLFRTAVRRSSFKAFALLGLIVGVSIAMEGGAGAGTADPLLLVYVFPGARDNGGGAGTGVATSIHCFSYSGVTEKLQYVALNFDSSLKASLTLNIGSQQTRTASTHDTVLYAEDLILNTGILNQGSVGVLSTTPSITCTGQVADASAAMPNGMTLTAVRFTPVPGTAY